MAMVMYKFRLLPLIQILKETSLTCISPGMLMTLGLADTINVYDSTLRSFKNTVLPQRDIFPEASKSIIIMQEHNREKAKACFEAFGLIVVIGSRYLGGFIGDKAAEQREWVKEKAIA